MKVIQYCEYGGPDRLRLADKPKPQATAGEVVIRICSVGVNPADTKWRAGMFRERIPLSFPVVPGYDVAGIIDQAGPGVTDLDPGDRVCAMLDTLRMGAYAEYVAAPADTVCRIPDELEFDVAAALPTPGLTGFQMIEEQLDVEAGQTLLVTGALGAVGRAALCAARRRGAKVVAAVRSNQVDAICDLGGWDVIVLGQVTPPGLEFDHVADTVGGPQVAELCRQVRRDGRVRTVSTSPIEASGLPVTPVFFPVHPDKRKLSEICELASRGELSMPIARRMPLEDAVEAHRLLEAGGLGGKIILKVQQ